jgi:ribose transport system permease protein
MSAISAQTVLNARRGAPQGVLRALDFLASYGVFVALAAVVLFMSLKISFFFTWSTFSTIAQSGVEVGVLAAGFTVAMVARQIDLSIGALVGFLASILGVASFRGSLPIWQGILLILGFALVVALVNGLLTIRVGINSVIVTFATAQILFGVGQMIQTRHQSATTGVVIGIPSTSWAFRLIAWNNQRWHGLPYSVWVMFGVYAVLAVLLTRTQLGEHIYAAGASDSAAERAGIRVRGIYWFVFVLTALCSFLAVFVYLGNQGGVTVGHGYGLEFDVLTAALLGGASFAGGVGRVERTLAGVFLLASLNFGMQTLQVDPNVTRMVKGGILISAVILSGYALRRRGRT